MGSHNVAGTTMYTEIEWIPTVVRLNS